MRYAIIAAIVMCSTSALAQQQSDPAKLAPLYRQQRDIANDAIAACAVASGDLAKENEALKARVKELEPKPDAPSK